MIIIDLIDDQVLMNNQLFQKDFSPINEDFSESEMRDGLFPNDMPDQILTDEDCVQSLIVNSMVGKESWLILSIRKLFSKFIKPKDDLLVR